MVQNLTDVKFYNNMTLVEYKSHQGTVEFDMEENIIYGHLICSKAISGYHGSTPQEFIEAFKEAVDEAIEDGDYDTEDE